jgi:hypothetical protein
MRLIVSILFLSIIHTAFGQSYKKFPEGIYWVNSEYNLSPETFKDKLTVVMFWEMTDPVALSQMRTLQALANKYPHIQLISIIQGDQKHKINLSELTDFTQEHNIHHPFGIASDLSPFVKSEDKEKLKIYVYEKSEEPTYVVGGPSEFPSFQKKLSDMVKDKEVMKAYGVWQMRSEMMPRDYADPLLELPTAVAIDEASNSMFVAENSLNRIVQYNGEGKLENLIGGIERGDKDNNLRGVRFGYVSGMSYDPINELLFVADVDFQKVKVIDVRSKIGYTFLGNGEINANITAQVKSPLETSLSYPVDVLVREKSLFVLLSYPAQVLELDAKGGAFISNAVLETKLGDAGRPIKLSKGVKGILVLTEKGYIFELPYEEDRLNPKLIYSPSSWEELVSAVEERKGELLLILPRKNQLVSIKKNKVRVIAGAEEKGYINAKVGAEVRFFQPVDMAMSANRVVIADRRNHMIRVTNLEKGNTFSVVPQYDFEFFTTGEALNIGEPVFFDSEILGQGVNEITLNWDISDYEIVEEGYNALVSDLSPGVSWGENPITEDGVKFSIDTSKAEEYVQVELYLTLRLKSQPDLIILKRAALNINFSVIPGESNSIELNYYPHLLH